MLTPAVRRALRESIARRRDESDSRLTSLLRRARLARGPNRADVSGEMFRRQGRPEGRLLIADAAARCAARRLQQGVRTRIRDNAQVTTRRPVANDLDRPTLEEEQQLSHEDNPRAQARPSPRLRYRLERRLGNLLERTAHLLERTAAALSTRDQRRSQVGSSRSDSGSGSSSGSESSSIPAPPPPPPPPAPSSASQGRSGAGVAEAAARRFKYDVLAPAAKEDAPNQCPICTRTDRCDPPVEVAKLACGHLMCVACVALWAEKTNPRCATTCPFCRTPMDDPRNGSTNPFTGQHHDSMTVGEAHAAADDAHYAVMTDDERRLAADPVPRRTRAPLQELLRYMVIKNTVGSLSMRYLIFATMWGPNHAAADGREAYFAIWLIVNHNLRAKFGEAACFASSEALYFYVKWFNRTHLSLALLKRYYLGTSCVHSEGEYNYLKRSIVNGWSSDAAWAETLEIVDARLAANAATLIDVFRYGGGITLTISGSPVEVAKRAGVLTDEDCTISFNAEAGFRAENSQPVQMLLALVHAQVYGANHVFEDTEALRRGLALQLVDGTWRLTSTTWFGLEARWSRLGRRPGAPPCQRESALIERLWARFADQAPATRRAHAATNKIMAFNSLLTAQQHARERAY